MHVSFSRILSSSDDDTAALWDVQVAQFTPFIMLEGPVMMADQPDGSASMRASIHPRHLRAQHVHSSFAWRMDKGLSCI
jgi:hypothetical protein